MIGQPRSRLPRPASVALLACLAVLAAPAWSAGPFRTEFYATAANDYVFRGVSQSDGEAALQLGVDLELGGGIYLGVWGSTVDFPANRRRAEPRRIELDAYIGYSRPLGRDVELDLVLVRYLYPSSAPAFHYDYGEVSASLHLTGGLRVTAAWSDDALGSGEDGLATELEFRREWKGWVASANVGRYALDRAAWRDYAYWDLGLSRRLGDVTLDLRYHDAGSAAERIHGAGTGGGRWVLSATADLIGMFSSRR